MTGQGAGYRWSSGAAYERYIGRWSRLVAREFVPWLGVRSRASWLDVGCGAGALVDAVLEMADPARVDGIDLSAGYVAAARSRITDSRATFRVGDAQELPYPDAAVSAAVSGLVLNFVPRPERMLGEMQRVVTPGGTVAAYVWDYAGEMQLLRCFWDAATSLDREAAALDEARRFPIARREALERTFEGAGLADVVVEAIDVPTTFVSFDDLWTPFLSGEGPAPGYCLSLAEEQRQALRERLRSSLRYEPDGSIRLTARALAAKGRKA